VIGIMRLLHWLRLPLQVSPPEALDRLARTRLLSLVLGVGFSLWSLAVFDWLADDARALVSMLVYVGAIGCAYCLASFPAAARIILLVTATPITLRLLATGEALLVCIAINLLLLLVLLARMLNTHFRSFVKLVASRSQIKAQRERAKAAEAAALAEKSNATRIAGHFDTALNNMSHGLCFFGRE